MTSHENQFFRVQEIERERETLRDQQCGSIFSARLPKPFFYTLTSLATVPPFTL
jgi:hypothetical protein